MALLLLMLAGPAAAQDAYGAKGIYPVYELSGEWLVFDKAASLGKAKPLAPGKRLLVIGSSGAEVFRVSRSSSAYGGACRKRQPLRLPAAILAGRREAVGRPVIGISVPETFSLKGSKARYRPLANQVSEDAYRTLAEPIKAAAMADIKSGAFPFRLDETIPPGFLEDPKPASLGLKIDFAASMEVKGLSNPFALIEGTQVLGSYRRCLRLSDGERLIGGCAEMPHVLMAETSLLDFVSYDPSGKGTVYLLAFNPGKTLWGDERWAIALSRKGPRLFLKDAMDPRCRESF